MIIIEVNGLVVLLEWFLLGRAWRLEEIIPAVLWIVLFCFLDWCWHL